MPSTFQYRRTHCMPILCNVKTNAPAGRLAVIFRCHPLSVPGFYRVCCDAFPIFSGAMTIGQQCKNIAISVCSTILCRAHSLSLQLTRMSFTQYYEICWHLVQHFPWFCEPDPRLSAVSSHQREFLLVINLNIYNAPDHDQTMTTARLFGIRDQR